jgi:hypothetical protein
VAKATGLDFEDHATHRNVLDPWVGADALDLVPNVRFETFRLRRGRSGSVEIAAELLERAGQRLSGRIGRIGRP